MNKGHTKAFINVKTAPVDKKKKKKKIPFKYPNTMEDEFWEIGDFTIDYECVPVDDNVEPTNENTEEWALYISDDLEIANVYLNTNEDNERPPSFILTTVDNKDYVLCCDNWENFEHDVYDDYDLFNDVFSSKTNYDVKADMIHLEKTYPECWMIQRNKGLLGDKYKTKN